MKEEPKLRDIPPETILAKMEERSDLLLELEEDAAKAEADLKSWEASAALAIKDSGIKMGMEEAKTRVHATDEWVDKYMNAQSAALKAAAMKRKYQSAVIASDLYRTEMATLRNVR